MSDRMSGRGAKRRSSRGVSRRSFLRRAAAGVGGAALGLPSYLPRGLRGEEAPSETITIGCIGVGSHGVHRNLSRLLGEKVARVVAVCDVFEDRREGAKGIVDERYGVKSTESWGDFRRVLDRSDIDAVMISTPDHWHVLMSVLAMRAGKDVICEKPTLTVAEGRVLADTVKSTKAVFQTSTEDRSLECYHRMAQVVRSGLLGKMRRVEVRLPRGSEYADPDPSGVEVPRGLDWEMWLGPAPAAAYAPERTEKMHWRQCFDYAGGLLTDWGMHQLDTVQWALDVERTGPVTVRGEGKRHADRVFDTFYEFDVEYVYESGVEVRVKSGGTSLRFEGEEGWIGNPRFAAPCEASDAELLRWEPAAGEGVRLPREPAGEHRSFLESVKSREEPYFPAEVGHRCATLCHLGNLAMLRGGGKERLRWDAEAERFEGDEEANEGLAREMRAPWSLEV